jgi:NAD(P)-dependent dehydrogenase (short-subunit alcohol dehydrogenase family)
MSVTAAGPGPARSIGAATGCVASRGHDVSIPIPAGVAVGLWRGSSPALNTSMMCMAEPQHGHGVAGVARSDAACSGAGGATSSSLRASARLSEALEGAAFGVRVNAVAPGPIETAMLDRFTGSSDRKAGLVAGVPLKRAGRPEEIADAIVFAASAKASFITGQVIAVNGGRTAS